MDGLKNWNYNKSSCQASFEMPTKNVSIVAKVADNENTSIFAYGFIGDNAIIDSFKDRKGSYPANLVFAAYVISSNGTLYPITTIGMGDPGKPDVAFS